MGAAAPGVADVGRLAWHPLCAKSPSAPAGCFRGATVARHDSTEPYPHGTGSGALSGDLGTLPGLSGANVHPEERLNEALKHGSGALGDLWRSDQEASPLVAVADRVSEEGAVLTIEQDFLRVQAWSWQHNQGIYIGGSRTFDNAEMASRVRLDHIRGAGGGGTGQRPSSPCRIPCNAAFRQYRIRGAAA